MSDNECERCMCIFKSRATLIKHLKNKKGCICIESKRTRQVILDELLFREGISCEGCSKKYATIYTLKRHQDSQNCRKQEVSDPSELSELKKEIKQMHEILKHIVNKPTVHNTTTSNIDNSVTNNNLILNCIMDVSGKSIDYLIQSENFKQRVIGWMKENGGLFDYIDEKFYNSAHPENWIIKKGDNPNEIKIHMLGHWKKLDNQKATDLILVNVGNDFMRYIDELKEDNDYSENLCVINNFDKKVMTPLDWGIDTENKLPTYSSSESEDEEEDKLLAEKNFTEKKQHAKITKKVIKHIHNK